MWASNNSSPVLTLSARVIGKRTQTYGGHGESSVRTAYYLTFEFDNGQREEFHVLGSEYGLLVEGDTGLLTYQGTRYHEFNRRR